MISLMEHIDVLLSEVYFLRGKSRQKIISFRQYFLKGNIVFPSFQTKGLLKNKNRITAVNNHMQKKASLNISLRG